MDGAGGDVEHRKKGLEQMKHHLVIPQDVTLQDILNLSFSATNSHVLGS